MAQFVGLKNNPVPAAEPATVDAVSTEVFEGHPDGEAVDSMTLTEVDGITTMSVLVTHTSKENRDGHVDSGMEGGMQIVMNRLDDVLASAVDNGSTTPANNEDGAQ